MGGKVWSVEEERVFWTEIIPSSKKQHLYSRPNRHHAQGWEALSRIMQERMGQLARRQYTALMLYEHFFQNSVLLRFSPNAGRFVRTYNENERQSSGLTPVERSRSVQNPAWRTGGPSAGSSTGPRPNTLRLSEARAAATTASANQPFGQVPEQQQHEDHHGTPLVGQTHAEEQSSSPTSSDKSTLATVATPCAETDPTSGQVTPTSSPAAVPPFSSLSNDTSLGLGNVQFSLPHLSEIMALPLLAAPPIPILPPNSLPFNAARLSHLPPSNDYQQRQQDFVPRQTLTDRYLDWRSGHSSRHTLTETGRSANPFTPGQESVASFGTVKDSLTVIPVRLLPPAPNQSPLASPEKPVAGNNKPTSAVEEIKQDEETDQLFVHQWPKA